MAMPPAVIWPEVGSVKRSSSPSSELFPAPLGPVTAMCSPGLIVTVRPLSAGPSRSG